MEDIQQLQDRVANLELALHAMWAIIHPLQPPDTQRAGSEMLAAHFDSAKACGHLIGTEFIVPNA